MKSDSTNLGVVDMTVSCGHFKPNPQYFMTLWWKISEIRLLFRIVSPLSPNKSPFVDVTPHCPYHQKKGWIYPDDDIIAMSTNIALFQQSTIEPIYFQLTKYYFFPNFNFSWSFDTGWFSKRKNNKILNQKNAGNQIQIFAHQKSIKDGSTQQTIDLFWGRVTI